ncbi:MAG TPA: YggS family pyridoxal phosphate-dependent enzyme [Thermoanaerobaculia bacterium]|nr:YggS family pyridoxal phosphate-dependent enzyme [Thermoanaerobaculia bacterium]
MSGSGVGERLQRLQRRIAEAALRAGRDPADVLLVGASKRQPLELLREAYDAGLRDFGENHVQEAESKAPQLPGDVTWHLLGAIQSNKIRRAVERFDALHAVDRVKTALLLERRLVDTGQRSRRLEAFLEVNVGGEETKHGFAPDELLASFGELATLQHLRLVGLMAIPPPSPDPQVTRVHFRSVRALRDRLRERHGDALGSALSMGMSDDFELAVEEGATHVRIGTSLFGARD